MGVTGFSISFFVGFRKLHLLSVYIKLGFSEIWKISIANRVPFVRFATSLNAMGESER